ncbi:hypothetical protein MGWOODY_XGa169 [hydrothermal vent metagenome]|uniref:Uncharacterized protein n=1 Tax=hydrothermal vent metagenome TaxID=652676 RepID=A0A160TNC9_9ZZZZ
MPESGEFIDIGLVLHERSGLLADIRHAVQTRLHASAADSEIHRTIVRMNDRVSHRQRAAGDESFLGGCVAGAIGDYVHGVDFTPTPVKNVHGILILGGELRTVTESCASG